MPHPRGVLPAEDITAMFEAGYITNIHHKHIRPASLDLPIADECYRLEHSLLPQAGEKVRDLLAHPDVNATRHDLTAPMEVGVMYLARVAGTIRLPEDVYGYCNPKSSSGRTNVFCRTIADGVSWYDSLQPAGWSGEIWVSIRPDSFPVIIPPGTALCQLRYFTDYTVLDRLDIEMAVGHTPLLFNPNGTPQRFTDMTVDASGAVFLTLDIDSGAVGFRCRDPSKVLDFGRRGYEWSDFFEPITAQNDRLPLRKGGFYILSTQQFVCVPPHLSAELRPIDVRLGDVRTHAAGYVDAGWGWGAAGEVPGRPLTLEVIPYENMLVRSGQIIVRIKFERMKASPKVPYDGTTSNYTTQRGPALSKHFRPDAD